MENLFPKIGTSITLSQEIAQNIEGLIVSKQLSPGQKLPTEKELCEMFGVSRTSLREALHMLSARDLINIRKGSGIYISEFSSRKASKAIQLYLEMKFDKDYILHTVRVRKMLEPQIARLAAENRTDDQLKELQDTIIRLKEAEDVEEEGIIDRDFHMIIARSTGNPIIPVIVDPVFRLMPKIRAIVYAKIDSAKSTALEYHEKIYGMIQSKNAEGAYHSMLEHIILAENHSLEIFETLTEDHII